MGRKDQFDAIHIPFLSSKPLWSVAMGNKAAVRGPEVQGKEREVQPTDLS